SETHERTLVSGQAMPALAFKPAHVDLIRHAMYGVTQDGTSKAVFVGAPYMSAGKTGTAQVVAVKANEKYNAAKLAEYQRDHSLYVGAAPLDDPQVVVACIVENAGWGAGAAAPIVRRVFDYLLLGQYPSEADMAALQQGKAVTPIGTPRRVQDIVLPGQLPPLADAAAAAPALPASSAVPGTPLPALRPTVAALAPRQTVAAR
ncbi:MAG: penicillin-binding protein 2, partial [Burkholderiales bacterium]|nr:penicillin-binding protein 2 [Burkholderiales bacterium]